MATPVSDLTQGVSAENLRRIDLICDEFEQHWRQGSASPVEQYLHRVDGPLWPALKQELLRVELEWRFRRDRDISTAEYIGRFPEWSEALSIWIEEARRSPDLVETVSYVETESRAQGPSAPAGEMPAAAPHRLPARLGEYDLIRPIGKGGMGEVYEAVHRRLGKRVAIKVLPPDRAMSHQALERFEREMRTVGQLDHPHLVEAHDAGEDQGMVYLVLRYLEGTDLKQLVEQQGPLDPMEACELIRQAALGLHHLHERGLVHRDVKPSNLIRTTEGQVKVIDMGLARWQTSPDGSNDLTAEGYCMGTPAYLAPEQIADATKVDGRTDLYGLGGTLFYLLAGRSAFSDRNPQAQLHAHLTGSAPDIRSVRPEVPVVVAAVVTRLLAKRPEDRYASTAELADELSRLIAGRQPSESTSTITALASTRWLIPLTVLVGSIAVAVLVWLAISFLGTKDAPTHSPPPLPNSLTGVDPTATRQTILVRDFELNHLKDVGGVDDPRGVLGMSSFTTHEGDGLKISAKLSEPAYCFIIAFWPDGGEDACFPEDETVPPLLTDNPKYPSVSIGVSYGLTDGTGLEGIFMVVSREPLPSYREWRKQLGDSPWKPTPSAVDVVWHYQQGELFGRTRQNPIPSALRGAGREVKGGGLIATMAEWLRRGPGIETVEGIGFSVQPAR